MFTPSGWNGSRARIGGAAQQLVLNVAWNDGNGQISESQYKTISELNF